MRAATAIASTVFSVSCLAGEPQAMVYLTIPFGQAPQVSFLLGSGDFRLLYRPKAAAEAATQGDAAADLNWWVVGGAVAAGVLIYKHQQKQTPQKEDRPCPAINPPPPNC
jgi:mannose/fructose/N-acetylgalactosamine-specific phosphotransferase system component IIC